MSAECRTLAAIFAMIISAGMFGGEARAGVITPEVANQVTGGTPPHQMKDPSNAFSQFAPKDSPLSWVFQGLREVLSGVVEVRSDTQCEDTPSPSTFRVLLVANRKPSEPGGPDNPPSEPAPDFVVALHIRPTINELMRPPETQLD